MDTSSSKGNGENSLIVRKNSSLYQDAYDVKKANTAQRKKEFSSERDKWLLK